jgi:hypothetical protein
MLTKEIGAANVIDTAAALKQFAASDHSLNRTGNVDCIVKPRNLDDVQKIIQTANREHFPVVPVSSGIHFNGNAVPCMGGVVMDLSKLNRFLNLDEVNHAAQIEVGVNWESFQFELEKKGYRSLMPLLPHSSRSVITDWLEREPPTIHVTEYAEPLLSSELVWGNGEKMVTGSASHVHFGQKDSFAEGVNPNGPGALSFHKFLQASQGTLGVVTWNIVKIEELPTLSKCLFIPLEKMEDSIEPLYKMLRRRVGMEVFLLNRVNMATILTEEWPNQFKDMKKAQANWTIVMVLSGLKRRPEEKIAYEENAILDIRNTFFPGMKVATTIPGASAIEKRLPEMLRKPWPKERKFWRHAYKGGCLPVTFICTMENATDFYGPVVEIAGRHDYPVEDLGVYLQPLENGRACHLEFTFYYDPSDAEETKRMNLMYPELARRLVDKGAYFNRPYGPVADLVYRRAGDYTAVLKRVKKLFDPNCVLNPGKLCF